MALILNRFTIGVAAEMEHSPKSKWLTFLFFLASSLAMGYFVFYLVLYAPEFAAGQPMAQADPANIKGPVDTTVMLSRGQAVTVGKIKLTYQGIEGDRIFIDVTLLELDPGYAYRREFDIQEAEKGFWMAEKYFRMVSAGRSVLQIVRVQG